MSTVQQTVLYEEGMKLDFLNEIYESPGGERIKHCIQCGTCSGSCPVSWAMEESPRKLFAMIRAGMRDKVLDSMTVWTCASCYQCAVRCPQDIRITDVMYILKRMSIREDRRRSRPAQDFSRRFVDLVNKYGRNQETFLLMGYFLANKPFASIGYAPLGLGLMMRGRMGFGHERIKGIDGLRKLIAKAQQLGGEA